jgi:membrane fusion protein, macrolide-specific efflux system
MTALQLATPESQTEPDAPPPRRRRRWLPTSAILVVLLVVGGAGTRIWQQHRADPLAGLEFAVARRAEIEDTTTALGKIQPREFVDVGAQVSGQLKRVLVQVGDSVRAGALLAEIDPQLQVAKLEIDRAQLAQLQAERDVQNLQVEFSAGQFERQIRMKEQDATREDVFERSRSEMRVAAAKLQSIEAQIRQVQSTTKADEAQLGYTRIFAPMTGTVVSIDARPGQTLIASQQVPVLLRIADLSSMTVWSQVSEADITRLRTGMELYFTTLGQPGRKWHGSLRQLLPSPPRAAAALSGASATPALNNLVLYTALFDVDNQAGELRPEMTAQVFFVVARAADAVVIPPQALREGKAGAATVSVVTANGELESRAVKVGIRSRFDLQIIEGLAAGERVVKHASGEDDEAQDSEP